MARNMWSFSLTVKVDYKAMAQASFESLQVCRLFHELGVIPQGAMPMFCNIQATNFHTCTKNIEINCHTIFKRMFGVSLLLLMFPHLINLQRFILRG